MRFIIIILCSLAASLQATDRIDSLKVDYIYGVYRFGAQAGALCGFNSNSSDSFQKWEVHFLTHRPRVRKLMVPINHRFIKVVSTQKAGYIIFEDNKGILLVKLSHEHKVQYIRVKPKEKYRTTSIIGCYVAPNNGLVLLKKYSGKYIQRNISHAGIEHTYVNQRGDITLQRLDSFSAGERKDIMEAVATENGMTYVYKQNGENRDLPGIAIDVCNLKGSLVKRILLRDSFHHLPSKVLYHKNQWIIAGYVLDHLPDHVKQTSGFFTLIIDSTGNEINFKKYNWKPIKDSLFNKTLRPIILGSPSPNSFRTNGEIDLLIEGIVTTDSGYSIICQGYSLGPGMTTLEFFLGMRDKGEVVLSLYDFVSLEITPTNIFTNYRLLDYTMSHVLIEPDLKTKLSFGRANKLDKLNVFPINNLSHKGIFLVNYDTLVPRASFYSLGMDSLVLGSSLLIPLADTMIYTEAERNAINDNKLLSWVDQFDKKTERTYNRLYQKSTKYAKGITKLDHWYNPRENRNNGWLWLSDEMVISYAYQRNSSGQPWTIYFNHTSVQH